MKTILAQKMPKLPFYDMQINSSHLEFSINIIVIFQVYCQK